MPSRLGFRHQRRMLRRLRATVPTGSVCLSSPWLFVRSCSLGGVVASKQPPKLRLTLLLWLSLLAALLMVATPRPAVTLNPLSPLYLAPISLTASDLPLCDSQQTTTTTGTSPPSTVGVACEPTDLTSNQTLYLVVVGLGMVLFVLFFGLGWSLWK